MSVGIRRLRASTRNTGPGGRWRVSAGDRSSINAAKVLPEPDAIWTNARGLSAFSDASNAVIAVTWHLRRPAGFKGESEEMLDRRDCGVWMQPFRVSGGWKEKTSRGRGFGSRPFVNRQEICLVLS